MQNMNTLLDLTMRQTSIYYTFALRLLLNGNRTEVPANESGARLAMNFVVVSLSPAVCKSYNFFFFF